MSVDREFWCYLACYQARAMGWAADEIATHGLARESRR